jgi:hypothetical protein
MISSPASVGSRKKCGTKRELVVVGGDLVEGAFGSERAAGTSSQILRLPNYTTP